MSTAAMQAAGQHVQVPTSNYSTPSTSRQYISSPMSNDESYYVQADSQPNSASQSRPHRRHQSQTASPRNVYPTELTYRDSPSHQQTTTHGRSQSSLIDQYDGGPIPPPRGSSQHTSPQTGYGTAKRSRHHTDQTAGQSSHVIGHYDDSMKERSRDESAVAASSASRNRRKGPASPDIPHRATSAKERGESSGLPVQSRSEAAMLNPPAPAPLIRENSEVINRIVVSDPLVDVERMHERIAEAQPAPIVADRSVDASRAPIVADEDHTRGPQRRQDYSKSSSRRKDVQFGDYVLGQTLGEGEFAKVKLGWKRDGSTQVAIKLIRRESVATNPTRLPKIYREISILRDLAHPNIVRLHEMVETERHIGIILEYASGGELFDFILNQRYLKDPQARRLFAQLVSGVGYLHKKGIVHRDLKLENLLLDQNRNIIITDFGFANTFDPSDQLTMDVESNLGSKDFVRKYKLDRVDAKGMRRGDLMQTSCGSPCYAAPELVVSDSLYTGRKVDVWSCGVILYAMLAGYLPFDDDPANPEGDNINLLYKYITTTPLTFPEYVTPHARDLLRRILVPDPRKRADLFEVARHSWLNEYHHVVAHITSSTTNVSDIANTTVPSELAEEQMSIPRSASVRAPKSSSPRQPSHSIGADTAVYTEESSSSKRDRNNRHTLQPEYVAPKTATARNLTTHDLVTSKTEPTAVSALPTTLSKQLPPTPPRDSPDPIAIQANAHPVRPRRDVPRSTSDTAAIFATSGPSQQTAQYANRPNTQGSMTAGGTSTTRADLRLPSRGSYGQPVAPTVAATHVEGQVTQPFKGPRAYNISGPIPQHTPQSPIGQALSQPMSPPPVPEPKPAHHRRSSTLSNLGERIFGRSNSTHKKEKEEARQRSGRKYPPTAMRDPFPAEPQPRMSTDSKRSFSFGLKKKESSESGLYEEKPRRFSLLPSSMSFKGLLGGSRASRDHLNDSQPPSLDSSQYSNRPVTGPSYVNSGEGPTDRRYNNFSRPPQSQYRHGQQQSTGDVYGGTGVYHPDGTQRAQTSHQHQGSRHALSQDAEGGFSDSRTSMQQTRPNKNVLVKPGRKFTDGYENESVGGASSGAVRKVQDFFRRRGRARVDSEYR